MTEEFENPKFKWGAEEQEKAHERYLNKRVMGQFRNYNGKIEIAENKIKKTIKEFE
jgi:hypothetical protein